jgi:putative DNA primase/helicase
MWGVLPVTGDICTCGRRLDQNGLCDCRWAPSNCECAPVSNVVKLPLADAPLIVPAPTNPLAVAKMFVDTHYTSNNGIGLLRHHRGDFHVYDGTCWPEAEDRTLSAELYEWLGRAKYVKVTSKYESIEDFAPTKHKISDIVDAVKAIGHLPARITPPVWMGDQVEIAATDVVAMANGLLHLPTRTLMPHTPDLFAHHSMPFGYDPDAPVPTRWSTFLEELWGDDFESQETLAEVMGYILGGGTRQQKLFLLVGPKRSGKGTIGRVLTGLLGAHNTTAPTLASMTSNFGLQDMVGKPLAVVSDARLGSRTDGLIAVERLLSISGEDSITIDRKYKDPWTGRLPTRFLIMTNEIPRFTDSSGALASRFVILTTNSSFYGREDPGLTDALLAEAPGIFNWALAGLDRLTQRGYFELPATAAQALRHLEDLSSPVGAFVRDTCTVGPAFEIEKDTLYTAWRSWCEGEGTARPSTKNVFLRDLMAAAPGLSMHRRRDGDHRYQVIVGVDLRKQWETSLTNPDHPDHRTSGQGSWSGIGPTQTRRSDGVVRDGQGSSALYSQDRGKDREDEALDAIRGVFPDATVVPGEEVAKP